MDSIADQKEIAKLFAKLFIARPELYAQQRPNGEWFPVQQPINMKALLDHLRGEHTIGHYMLNAEGKTKLFAFDIDLEKANPERNVWWPMPGAVDKATDDWADYTPGNPRIVWEGIVSEPEWMQRFLVMQMRRCVEVLVRSIEELIPEVRIAVAYSGHKGIHIYGFTGLMSAAEAREAASFVLDHTGRFEAARGKNFFKHKSPYNGDENFLSMPQLSVEIFPKQDNLSSEKQMGNLMRLPLGRNLAAPFNHPHQAKFIDLRHNLLTLVERSPLEALTVESQWSGAV